MKISDYINAYENFTDKASTIARQLVFSGLALIWIFKNSKIESYSLPIELYLPILAFLIALVLDLFQYISGSIIWYGFYRYHEDNTRKSMEDDPDIESPLIFTYFLNTIFILKVISVIVGYYFLIEYTASKITFI